MKKKVLVISARYGLSGVPLAQLKLANGLAERNFEVDLTYGYVNNGLQLPQNKKFKIFSFNKKRTIFLIYDLIKYIKSKKPEIIFSAADHLNFIVILSIILANSNCKVSCSSRVTPLDTYEKGLLKKGWLLKILMKLLMFRANVLSCVSKDMVLQYKKIFPKGKFVPIYNIAYNDDFKKKITEEVSHKWILNKNKPLIISAGMLEEWKRFDLLINAFSLLKKKIDCNLIILGEGSKKKNLENLVKKLNIEESVDFLGNVLNPFKYFINSDLFVLSSRVEGLPNVLIEAMACGCTIVSTDCPTGPREILKDGEYGYLCESGNYNDIYEKMLLGIKKPIPKKILEKGIDPFMEANVIKKHLEYLNLDA